MQHQDEQKRLQVSEEAFGRPEQSLNYALFRPSYPEFFFSEEISNQVSKIRLQLKEGEKIIALDLGCGPGQATFQIAKYFDKVVGIDINATQLAQAQSRAETSAEFSHVTFMKGDCSKLEAIWREQLGEQPVHAIFMCQSFHWFNQGDILDQCRRICAGTKGCVFLLAYSKFRILPSSGEIKPYFDDFYNSIHHVFDFDRDVLNSYYKSIDFSLQFDTLKMIMHNHVQLNYPIKNFICYLDTISAYRNKLERIDKTPEEDSLKILCDKLGFRNYHRQNLHAINSDCGPQTVDFATPFFMYILI